MVSTSKASQDSPAKQGPERLPAKFWWLWVSILTNRLGDFVVPFLALYLTAERGMSTLYAGLVVSLYGLGGAASSVVGGCLTDRFGRRPTMLGGRLSTAGAMAALGFAEGPWAIAGGALLTGFCAGLATPALLAMVGDMVPPAGRRRAFAMNQWAVNIGFASSCAVAGVMAGYDYRLLFIGDAVTTAVCALVVFIKIPETRSPQGSQDAAATAAKPVRGEAWRDRPFLIVTLSSLLIAIVAAQFSSTLPITMHQAGLTTQSYGFIVALNGLLVVLLQIPLIKILNNQPRSMVLLISSIVIGCGFGLTSLADGIPFYAMTVVIWTLGEIGHGPPSMALASDMSPAHARGQYQGLYSLTWTGAALIAPATGGLVLDVWGQHTLWTACFAVAALAGTGYAYIALRQEKEGTLPAATP